MVAQLVKEDSITQTVYAYLLVILKVNSLTETLVSHVMPHVTEVARKVLLIVTNVREDSSKMKINYVFNRKSREKTFNVVEALF